MQTVSWCRSSIFIIRKCQTLCDEMFFPALNDFKDLKCTKYAAWIFYTPRVGFKRLLVVYSVYCGTTGLRPLEIVNLVFSSLMQFVCGVKAKETNHSL